MERGYDKEEGGEAYEDYEPYSPLHGRGRMDKSLFVYIAAGVGVLALILLIFFFRSSPQTEGAGEQVAELEKRLDDLEFRLAEVEAYRSRIDGLESKGLELDDMTSRYSRFESSVAGHLNQLDDKVAALEKKKTEPPAAKKTPKADAPPPPKADSRIHVVQSGETLYSISRKYNTSINAIRKLNGIDPDQVIRPGQKLKVSN
ncbi:MAG: LysM domain-containing protein [Desulfobacterales bacterium]|jgi:LysM repeat protein